MASNKSHILIYFWMLPNKTMQVLPCIFPSSDFPILLACWKACNLNAGKSLPRLVRIEVLCESTGDLYQLGCQTYSSNSELDEVWWKSNPRPSSLGLFWAPHFGRGFGGFFPQQKFQGNLGCGEILFRIWPDEVKCFFLFWRVVVGFGIWFGLSDLEEDRYII